MAPSRERINAVLVHLEACFGLLASADLVRFAVKGQRSMGSGCGDKHELFRETVGILLEFQGSSARVGSRLIDIPLSLEATALPLAVHGAFRLEASWGAQC